MSDKSKNVITQGDDIEKGRCTSNYVSQTVKEIQELEAGKNLEYYLGILKNHTAVNLDTVLSIYNMYIKENENIQKKYLFFRTAFLYVNELEEKIGKNLRESLIHTEYFQNIEAIINTGVRKLNTLIVLIQDKYNCPNKELLSVLSKYQLDDDSSLIALERIFSVNGKKIEDILQKLLQTSITKRSDLIKGILSFTYILKSYESDYILSKLETQDYNLHIGNISRSQIQDLFDSLHPYKKLPSKQTPYTPYEVSGPFNLININTKLPIELEQKGGHKIHTGEQSFYTISNRINVELQLSINRLFAPYLGMTRLLKLRNGNEIVVSIDVNQYEAQDILGYKDRAPNMLIQLGRLIYQFVAIDPDRQQGVNLENNIIYDFDRIFDHIGEEYNEFVSKPDKIIKDFEFALPKLDTEYKKELAKNLYFFKSYLYKFSTEELKKLDQKKEKGKEVGHEIYNFWLSINKRSIMLNMIHLLLGMNISHGSVIKVGLEVDRMVKQIDNEYHKA